MDLHEISTNVAVAIPYTNFKQKIKIVDIELRKNRYIEIWDKQKLIYSERRWRDKDGDSRKISN